MVAILVPDYMTIPLHYLLAVFLRLNFKFYVMEEPNKKKRKKVSSCQYCGIYESLSLFGWLCKDRYLVSFYMRKERVEAEDLSKH